MARKNYYKTGKGLIIGLIVLVVVIVFFLASKNNWNIMKDTSNTSEQSDTVNSSESDLPNAAPEMFTQQTVSDE